MKPFTNHKQISFQRTKIVQVPKKERVSSDKKEDSEADTDCFIDKSEAQKQKVSKINEE